MVYGNYQIHFILKYSNKSAQINIKKPDPSMHLYSIHLQYLNEMSQIENQKKTAIQNLLLFF